ncbi:MJ0042 family finger-like domain-containing protein [Cognatiyoonia koreensis]|uniref:MJ0042 family finger-like domain-containing protein n=1 Tax=Cognatiyoonia koreensis TaxID=364200 RepID=A0A1I0RD73_9RHOB|nr:zinc-ribbon domain-containing protein [Cognatiyoonia koreensis]SEW38793.1 MJ0042 family finger-like domain-containing protein [Cognatiyoonia koreensis]
MRLICPNCGAQYEVADDVIPENGRDVQCSNCGHTWFESPGASEAAEAAIESDDTATDDNDGWTNDQADDDSAPATPHPQANRPALDASVAEILREEAEREAAARRADVADPMESQEDLGLEDPPSPTSMEQRNIETAKRIARLQGEEEKAAADTAAAAAAAAAASRKELLPDIEEINSTLRSSAERGETVDPTPEEVAQTKKRSFRFGFFTVLILLAIFWAIYLFADQIAQSVPSLAGALEGYVELVDNGRLWLDLKVQELSASMEAESVSTDAPAETAVDTPTETDDTN